MMSTSGLFDCAGRPTIATQPKYILGNSEPTMQSCSLFVIYGIHTVSGVWSFDIEVVFHRDR